ncbi:serine O-acetyltransferase EpsC [Lachnoclostridium sp. An181]|uniref:serine O-acetyltransferase EpsC n=1 Tax=Lachnoclostridium sp. An181 TaxID=1965575 RepID=UPI000B38B46F|nr:serine O-acetyltransferase EpsC [Lachnoclostridium sp. An181]OUP49835.1 serine acetyltransferase [Lachnoclostridium sp. An181]
MGKKKTIQKMVDEIGNNYKMEELFCAKKGKPMPERSVVIDFIRELKTVMFPGYFGRDTMLETEAVHYVGYKVNHLYDVLKEQVKIALTYEGTLEGETLDGRAEEVCDIFFGALPGVQRTLLTDIQAGFDGDPAAHSKEEIIFSYPGLFAIYVYRIAHILYKEKIPFIPRVMSEYAHGRTGIDINPGAEIGEYFFIDHGTGVVIGETTKIGDHVKLYQGVTLGALSTRDGQQLSGVKRHPTIEDHVTVYSNSSVLGGETVIGANTIIGGNTFITQSVPANTKVSAKAPELVIKVPKKHAWDWEE